MDDVMQTEILGKLPRAPYPGLRPFLDHEEMLMFGRELQLAEIIRRLRDSRFVAVIGGSGSGKSSLVRAGVVPHLRRYGIPEVGDLWLPVVFTPGTNPVRGMDGETAQTPLDRLSARFERRLHGKGSEARRADIAALLRRPGGLARLVEAYAPDFDLPPGVGSASACVLFVVDQFEELFDKSNRGVADARHLVERVIDHFHLSRSDDGQSRCFVLLTMRSEHLNDCAGFLGLPEAINTGSYLVSRLDDEQLKQVISKPAQRFLRLKRRLDSESETLPDSVEFDTEVVKRLLRDTGSIANDPDHLPLLQHALARSWEAACRREGVDVDGVPARITLDDLWLAATGVRPTPERVEPISDGRGHTAPGDHDNVLRISLENWAERIFAEHTKAERVELEVLLRQLAFKDPRTGVYSQQRVNAAEYGEPALWGLVKDGFVGQVNYLFWDDEDPQHVTLKVSLRLALVLAPFILYAVFVQGPVANRAAKYFKAAEQANLARTSESQDSIGGGETALALLVDAAGTLGEGQTGENVLFGQVPEFVLEHRWSPLSWLRLKVAEILPAASRSVEPVLNEKLRAALSRAVWKTGAFAPAGVADALIDDQVDRPVPVDCGGQPGVLVPVAGRRKDDPVRRGFFLSKLPVGTDLGKGNRLLFSATLHAGPPGSNDTPRCELGRQLLALPMDRNPAVLFDASLQYMLLAADGEPGQTPSVSVHRIQWGDPDRGECASIEPPRAVVSDPGAVSTVRVQAANQSMGQAASTWRVPGGRAFRVGDDGWWIIAGSATRLVPTPENDQLVKLDEAGEGNACHQMRKAIEKDVVSEGLAGYSTSVYHDRNYCLAVSRGFPATVAGASMSTASCGARQDNREQVILNVYFKPRATGPVALENVTRLATFQFGRFMPSEKAWYAGAPGGVHDGWLMLQRQGERGVRYVGAPWSTDALMRLGHQVLKEQALRKAPAEPTTSE